LEDTDESETQTNAAGMRRLPRLSPVLGQMGAQLHPHGGDEDAEAELEPVLSIAVAE